MKPFVLSVLYTTIIVAFSYSLSVVASIDFNRLLSTQFILSMLWIFYREETK